MAASRTNSRAPHEIRDDILQALRAALKTLKSPEVVLAIRKKPKAQRQRWAQLLLDCDAARDELERIELAQIRDDLKENDDELKAGAKKLKAAAKKSKQVAQLLTTASTLLSILARVAALL